MLKASFLQSWPFIVSLAMVFVITFVVFPGVCMATSIKFLQGVSNYSAWYGLFMVTVFNIFDTIGRSMGGMPLFSLPDKIVIVSSYCRAIFIVTFFLIAYKVSPSGLFGNDADWFKVLNMILFAFSNGFIST